MLLIYICLGFGLNSKKQVQKILLYFNLLLLLTGIFTGFANHIDNHAQHCFSAKHCDSLSSADSQSENSLPDLPLELAEKPDQKEEFKTDFDKDFKEFSSTLIFYYFSTDSSVSKRSDSVYFKACITPLYRLFHCWKHFV